MAKAATKKKTKAKISKKEQYERFRQTARELGCDENEEAFELAFKKIVPSRKPRQSGG
jgi:hypothetical protein